MTEPIVRFACLLALTGCVAQIEDADPEAAGAFEDEPGVDLEEAPPMEALLAQGVEPIMLEIPAEVSRSLLVDKKLIGADNRTRIANTTVAPYATIATLLVTFPTGRTGLCTGSMIGADAVLTAGHCVYNANKGGFARNVRVIPGSRPDANGRPTEPFGSTSGRKLYTPAAYRSATSFWQREPNDYAVIRTNLAIGDKTGVRKVTVMSAAAVGRRVKLVGYHSDLCQAPPCTPGTDAFVMHASNDQIRQLFSGGFNHYADSMPGSSGSPLVSDGAEANAIFAVHVAGLANPATGAEWNMGVLLSRAAYTNIRNWASAP